MGDVGRFQIDSDELDAVIADLERCERNLAALTDRIEGQMRQLHEVWEGLAADAQAEAQREWDDGMRAMRQALADLRAAARQAHDNYTSAATTNLKMWEQLR
ncbi:WXG100 family type VII secretion target [Nocardioides ferulae]|uniref:WXG100 family type VII secretion target n=1 Tax=Nocardioides ferulae TaxID=2340821 RepID=UPI000EB1A120|nr:WXG100 family type VII secretion target [Nocardioides ferulae]